MLKKVIASETNNFAQNNITKEYLKEHSIRQKKLDEVEVREWLKRHDFFENVSLNAPTDLRTPDKYGKTPMYTACNHGYLKVAQWLFENGAAEDIRIAIKEDQDCSPIHMACASGYLDVAKWLVEKGEDIRKANKFGWTPMSLACSNGRLELAQWLFENGAAEDIGKVDNNGKTPMQWACLHNELDVAQWLHSVGADIREENTFGLTPMIYACWNGYLELAQWLCSVGADIRQANSNGDTPMLRACRVGQYDLKVAKWLILKGALNTPEETGHVDSVLVRELVKQLKTDRKEQLLRDLLAWAKNLHEHPAFKMVLIGTLDTNQRKGSLHLWKLNKLDKLTSKVFKQKVADFVGISGFNFEPDKHYQNVQEFSEVLKAILAEEGGAGAAGGGSAASP